MDDPVLFISVALAVLVILVAWVGRPKPKKYKTSTAWRKSVRNSLWVITAMFFGGASDPVEKGKVVKVRKRDADDADQA